MSDVFSDIPLSEWVASAPTSTDNPDTVELSELGAGFIHDKNNIFFC